ncbi:PRTRC system protein C [Sphingobacterium sp. SGG-5]|uniref:M60 family metallopeptidase n=1 Tax=Sphingobacterium sp. SGG-5 TaxID=2710881 RepID=UPI0013EE0D80|nr:M60 family metallopeptidase [Sphingobacterium sp. SGG-5]NGM62523.1 PRTRC system protein C [Sphingobacterium sp. SGG-5]
MKKLFLISLFIPGCFLAFSQSKNDLKRFGREDLTTLDSKTSAKKISTIQDSVLKEVATAIYQHNYPLSQRYKSYTNYLDPKLLSARQKTTAYSQFENPTGIYFPAGEEALIWVGRTSGQQIALVVANWDDEHFKKNTYPLSPGLNRFTITNKGNSYIQYFTADNKEHPDIDVHILSGKINGVFDIAKDDNAAYQQVLAHTYGPVVDLVGKKVHLAYAVESLKKENPKKGVELMQLYDSIIHIQHEMMGLVKYHREPKNHMFGRVIWKGFMHADGMGAAFHNNTMKNVANIPLLRKNSWGVAHEFGHVNQVRPNMKWVGTTEVTNNIYSVWTQYVYNPNHPKLEREQLKDYDERTIGGRITAYMESAFVHHQPWLTQAGPDRWKRERPRDWGGDHFVKLVPLWQLQLYFAVAGEGNEWGNRDFYGDIFIKAIDNPVIKAEQNSYYQLEFVKNACDVAQLDLTDFFAYSGILAPIDLIVDDYTVGRMKITADDIRQVKSYASKYPKPSTPVLHYLTANSVDIYKNQATISGTKDIGFEKQGDKIIVDNSMWKNAVAFETYAGDRLIKVAFRGAGSADVKTTTVRTPRGTTAVKAVGWDGKRIDVL